MSSDLGQLTPALPSRSTGEIRPEIHPVDELFVKQGKMPRSKRGSRKALKQSVRKGTVRRAKKAAPAPAKNRNRPLEMKTRLNAVLGIVSGMSKAEAAVFTAMMQHLEDRSRGARRRILAALSQVYGA